MLITIKDETCAGKILNEIELEFQEQVVTVAEIISNRVQQEVKNYNKKLPAYFNGLVEPLDAEKTLNGYKLKNQKTIDAEKQVYVALDAFQRNGYFVLIDDVQSESLQQKVLLKEKTKISFIKLTPLVGG
jgi:23S rRNA pseudoU1915 N3-methylase RlmH